MKFGGKAKIYQLQPGIVYIMIDLDSKNIDGDNNSSLILLIKRAVLMVNV